MHKIYQNSLWGDRHGTAASSLSHGDRYIKVGWEEGNSWRLEVQPLWCALLLLVQDVFLWLLEVFIGDFHTALPQGHEACLCADGLQDTVREEDGRWRESLTSLLINISANEQRLVIAAVCCAAFKREESIWTGCYMLASRNGRSHGSASFG